MDIVKIRRVVALCSFPDFIFSVELSSVGGMYLRGEYLEKDTTTGELESQYTRRWNLSPLMTKDEIVATAFKCILTSMEHRTREWFLYRNRPIFNPHQSVDKLWESCEDRVMREG
jgi:hypothetical protein